MAAWAIAVDWRLHPGGPLADDADGAGGVDLEAAQAVVSLLIHLPPPQRITGVPDAAPVLAGWRSGYFFNACVHRHAPGFIQVRDRRYGELSRITIEEPEYIEAIEALQLPTLVQDVAEEILADFEAESLVGRVGDYVWWLPYRLRRCGRCRRWVVVGIGIGGWLWQFTEGEFHSPVDAAPAPGLEVIASVLNGQISLWNFTPNWTTPSATTFTNTATLTRCGLRSVRPRDRPLCGRRREYAVGAGLRPLRSGEHRSGPRLVPGARPSERRTVEGRHRCGGHAVRRAAAARAIAGGRLPDPRAVLGRADARNRCRQLVRLVCRQCLAQESHVVRR